LPKNDQAYFAKRKRFFIR